ncbi:MAG: hypothetical protein P8X74_09585 [Reinekea sp.]
MTTNSTTDSYGTRFCLLSRAEDFRTDAADHCVWDEQRQVFRLMENQRPRLAQADASEAQSAWSSASAMVMDSYGQLGFLSDDRKQLHYALNWAHYQRFLDADVQAVAGQVTASSEQGVGGDASELSLDPVDAPDDTQFRDLAIGGDGRVALPFSNGIDRHAVCVVHLSRRWQRTVDLPFVPVRAAVDDLNRIWVAGDNRLALCTGEPLPQDYQAQSSRFEPVDVNPNRLALRWQQPLPANRTLMALCCDQRHLYLLMQHNGTGVQEIWQRPLNAESGQVLESWLVPAELPLVVDIGVLSDATLALMIVVPDDSDLLDQPALQLNADGTSTVLARRYPLDGHGPLDGQPRVRFLGQADVSKVWYLSGTGPRQLVPLPQARFLSEGHAILNQTLDSGDYDIVWHRIYLDASIPPGCSLNIQVKAFDDYDHEGRDWQPQAAPIRLSLHSELPFYSGRLTSSVDHGGLYEILLQRQSGAVREIRGRYLKLRIEMTGDGRHSPAIAEMRVYYPRFSWQQNYLPALFHQYQSVDIEDESAANGADLRERLLASFEGLMTPVEERIVNAECWLYPDAVPAQQFPQLAGLLGTPPPSYWPLQRQRRWLAATGWLQANKGTAAGLAVALDIATDGAVGLGQIVPVENYRLRRTLATIIGVSLDDEAHPLTLGTSLSGNSIVGQSLILTDEDAADFLALFAPELAETEDQQQAVQGLFDRYAHRISIVIHEHARPWRKAVEQIIEQMVPGSVHSVILETDRPFVLGLSPLLGIDTYLQQAEAFRNIVLNDTWLGREGLIHNPAALSPADVHQNQTNYHPEDRRSSDE